MAGWQGIDRDLIRWNGKIEIRDEIVPSDPDQYLVTKKYVDEYGGVGETDHDKLDNLDFASAGHTGFASETDLTTHTDLTDEHIDWTNATDNFKTTGTAEIQGVTSIKNFLDMEYTGFATFGSNRLRFYYTDNDIANLYAMETSSGPFLFMAGPNGLDIGDGNWLGRPLSKVGKIYLSGDLNDGTNSVTVEGLKTHLDLTNEHIDWTISQTENIHEDNYTDTDTTYTAGTGLDLTGTEFSNTDTGTSAVTTHETTYNHENFLTNIESESVGDLSDIDLTGIANDKILKWDTNKFIVADESGGENDFIMVVDEKTEGTNGGTFTSGAWRTRDLNTVKENKITGASLSQNIITLPAGTYSVEASSPAYRVNRHKIALYDDTASEFLIYGSSEYNGAGYYTQTRSFISGVFTISVETEIKLVHKCENSNSIGFGVDSNFGDETFSIIKITKID